MDKKSILYAVILGVEHYMGKTKFGSLIGLAISALLYIFNKKAPQEQKDEIKK